MDSLVGWLGLILGFNGLVFVHELGHYLLAKWNGVRVPAFSIGMGPYLVSFTLGETVYALSLIPVGGYVKLAGQDDLRPDLPPSRDPRDFRNRPAGQRVAIAVGGAVFNLLFALLLFTLCYLWGVEFPPPFVGDQTARSPLSHAEVETAAGRVPCPLRRGDLITALDGVPVKSTLDVALATASAGPGHDVWVRYERDNQPAQYPVVARPQRSAALGAADLGLDGYQQETALPLGFRTERGVYVQSLVADSPAALVGLSRGDKILEMDGKKVTRFVELVDAVQASGGREVELRIERAGAVQTLRLRPEDVTRNKPDAGGETTYQIGIGPAPEYRVLEVDSGCEAYQAGLRAGAYIGGAVRLRDRERIGLGFTDAQGHGHSIRIPAATACGSPLRAVVPMTVTREYKYPSVWEACTEGWNDLVRHSLSVFVILKGLVTGALSTKMVSGPIGIAQAFKGVAQDHDLTYYLWFTAFISVNLGVLQCVPVPLLDGWMILIIFIEKLKGSPVPVKVLERCQLVGMILLAALMLWATKNDIVRMFMR